MGKNLKFIFDILNSFGDTCHNCGSGSEARFLNQSKQCISCNTDRTGVLASIDETNWCCGVRYQAGAYNCSCSDNSSRQITTEEEEGLCLSCPQRVVRQDSLGRKYCSKLDCSLSASYANIPQETCHYYCSSGTAFWHNNTCYTCLYNNQQASTEEECNRCEQRYWYNNKCIKCPDTTKKVRMIHASGASCETYDDQFFGVNDNKAYACSTTTNVKTLPEECGKCQNRHMENGVCKLCPNGTLSEDGITCGIDLENQFLGSDNKFHQCDQATASASTKEQCDRCPGRYYLNNNCYLTPKGYYSNNGVKTECGTGHYCPDVKMTQPLVCAPGTYASSANLQKCTDCSQGYYCPKAGMAEQWPCDLGHYCPGKNRTDRLACPVGTYSDTRTAGASCKNCPKGQYQDQTGAPFCKVCPGNSVTTAGGQNSCTLCSGDKPCSNSDHTACVAANTNGAVCS